MKYIFFIILFCFSSIMFGQNLTKNEIYETLVNEKVSLLHSYRCTGKKAKIVVDTVFRNEYRKIFSAVILNSDDIIANGNAFSYSIADKTKLSTNFSFFLSKNSNYMLDLGLNIKSESANFIFYDKNGFGSDIGLKAGLVIPICKNTMYFDKKPCFELAEKRKLAMDKKLLVYKTTLLKDISELKGKKDVLEQKITQQTSLLSSVDGSDYISELTKINDDIKNLEFLLVKDVEELKKLIKRDISEFDTANNPFTGYKSHWLNISGNFNNLKPTISNDSIISKNVIEKNKGIYRFAIEGSYNFQLSAKKNLFYLQINGRFNNESVIDNPFFTDKKVTVKPITQIIEGVPTTTGYELLGDDFAFANYNQLNDSQPNYDVGFLLSWFGIFNKSFGFSFKTNYNFTSGKELEFNYQNNYTTLLGLNFRMVKETDLSKATFAINCGFENVPTDVNAWDQFIVKASIGVPFNIFSKDKTK